MNSLQIDSHPINCHFAFTKTSPIDPISRSKILPLCSFHIAHETTEGTNLQVTLHLPLKGPPNHLETKPSTPISRTHNHPNKFEKKPQTAHVKWHLHKNFKLDGILPIGSIKLDCGIYQHNVHLISLNVGQSGFWFNKCSVHTIEGHSLPMFHL